MCQSSVSDMSARSRRPRWPPTVIRWSASTSTPTRWRRSTAARSPIVEPGLYDALAKTVAEGPPAGDDRCRRGAFSDSRCRSSASARRAAATAASTSRHLTRRVRADRGGAPRQTPATTSWSSAARCCRARPTASSIPALERTSGKKYGDGFGVVRQPRVPARRDGAQGLPRAAVDARRPQPRGRRDRDHRACISRSTRRSSAPASAWPR